MILFLIGCGDYVTLRDAFEGATDPLVVQASYVGVEALPEGLDLGSSDWAKGSAARVFVAETGSVGDLGRAPISDASVAFEGANSAVSLRTVTAGTWEANAGDGLSWSPGDDALFTIERDGEHILMMSMPASPVLDLPQQLSSGDPLIVDIEGQAFDNLLVVVIRLADGETVYDSMPTDINDLFTLTHAAGELATEVPASTFAEPGAYAVGVAGLVNGDSDNYQAVNLALSALTSGSMRFSALTVHP